ncbi:hypothetical protein SPRG_05145 [Saprolegnia parasitica CBS 223.65]|uniref:TRP C-terminal domain-containing protein n=1 Tax=Saprolegnia parasitica (strain CBS 223.65) TaxID=695850 RepID=A0A067CL63_SAPPC|nr:hypothetical protein SPRG_05145 [Saprolegnia parasitica CBS 223.65]KDO29955.1 hypothetical protein SPRG_05145 [Saprolegnia parasitica CBS 223.65]|eukprot:XP_012199139.1 hypothetical protein SPRG_05145 [Saprolegnia parasitica CBS 223.65]
MPAFNFKQTSAPAPSQQPLQKGLSPAPEIKRFNETAASPLPSAVGPSIHDQVAGSEGGNESFSYALIETAPGLVDTLQFLASEKAQLIVGAAVSSSLLTSVISMVLSSTLPSVTNSLSVASSTATAAGPPGDFVSFWVLIDYLQFLASSGHMEMPSAPPFYLDFTDSLAWTVLNVPPSWSGNASGPTPLSADALSIAQGDIIAGVLSYAQRLHIHPEALFQATVVGFASVVGIVVVVVSGLYGVVRLLFGQRLRNVKKKLASELPQDRLFLRLLLQAALGIALMSEYALSMTSSFQLRFTDSSGLCFATLSLSLICCGLLVLGVCMLHGKSATDLAEPGFKFTWGGYYKTYTFEQRYFFVAKMGAEVLSGIVIGAVSNVPTQLTLLLSLQFGMFLYLTHCSPYLLDFQNVCASIAFVMKMATYALLSSFVIADVDHSVQTVVGTCALVLQIALLLLFNSRQLYILSKQTVCIWHRLKKARRAKRQAQEDVVVASALDRDSFAQVLAQSHHRSASPCRHNQQI